nr:hypothetical protein [Desulfobulbaceae bacterium]
MSNSMVLPGISNVIESAIVQFYYDNDELVTDSDAARIVELLMDQYHFNDEEPRASDPLHTAGFDFLSLVIKGDLDDISEKELVKVLAAIYRSIQRRTDGRIEYINFVRNHVI